MQILGFPDFLGSISRFQVDSRFSRSPDYHVEEIQTEEQWWPLSKELLKLWAVCKIRSKKIIPRWIGFALKNGSFCLKNHQHVSQYWPQTFQKNGSFFASRIIHFIYALNSKYKIIQHEKIVLTCEYNKIFSYPQ